MDTPNVSRATLRHAVVGGAVVTVVMGLASLTVGLTSVGGGEARRLLEATLPVAQTLFSTAMIASSTTLALMLTMLGMTSEQEVEEEFYAQIRQAATIAVGVFSTATVVLLVLSVPFREGDGAGGTLYTALYYAITVLGALVGGALVAVMITLYSAIRNLIAVVDDEADADIVQSDSDG